MVNIKKVIQGKTSDHLRSNTTPHYSEGAAEQNDTYQDIFAFDIGFGYDKFKSTNTEGSIASLCMTINSLAEIQMDKADMINSLAIEHEGQIVLVGTLAAKYNRQVARSTFRDRAIDDNFQALYKAAIVAAYHQYSKLELKVITGLPNDDLDQKQAIEKIIRGIREVKYFYDDKIYTISIKYDNVIIRTQPEGFHAELMFDDDMQPVEPTNEKDELIRRMGVLDFGHGTLNMSVFEGNDLLGVGGRTCSVEGINAIYQNVSYALKQQFENYEPSHLDIESAIVRNTIRVKGSAYKVDQIVTPIIKKYAQDSFRAIYEKWKGELDQLNAIFITGGGSNIVSEDLAKEFLDKARYSDVYTVDSAQLLNVRGYYKIGKGC